MVSARVRFWILIGLVGISGFSQGMLMPTIAIIFEQAGISSSVNGIHATALYIGILVASPFLEKPMMKIGYKPFIVLGGIFVFVSLFSFTLWNSLIVWFVLRLLIGVGDQMIHFGSQTWITTTASGSKRGVSIALYGLSFGLGFAMGPMLTRLVEIHETLPFMISAFLSMSMWLLIFLVKNEKPDVEEDAFRTVSSTRRITQTLKIAWVAMLPGFAYGILESTLHSTFPVYGLRIGHDVDILSLIIPLFALGSVVIQVPLGALSDRIGRRHILIFVFSIGIICFTLAGLLESSVVALFILFAVSGMFVGSTFSLGIAYMTDLLPTSLLPAGNIVVGVCFSIGSILGPFLGGIFIEAFPNVSMFYLIVALLAVVLIVLLMNKEKPMNQTNRERFGM